MYKKIDFLLKKLKTIIVDIISIHFRSTLMILHNKNIYINLIKFFFFLKKINIETYKKKILLFILLVKFFFFFFLFFCFFLFFFFGVFYLKF
jgi:hypothetical protein